MEALTIEKDWGVVVQCTNVPTGLGWHTHAHGNPGLKLAGLGYSLPCPCPHSFAVTLALLTVQS